MKIMQSFLHNYMSMVNVLKLKHTQNIKAIACTRSNLLVELYLVIAYSGISTAVKLCFIKPLPSPGGTRNYLNKLS